MDAVSPGLGITDSVNINGKVTGPIDAPVINGSFTMDKLEIAPLVATGINGNYNYTNGLVTLSNTYANVYSGTLGVDVQLRTSEHRSMYSYVRLSIDRCTATYV